MNNKVGLKNLFEHKEALTLLARYVHFVMIVHIHIHKEALTLLARYVPHF